MELAKYSLKSIVLSIVFLFRLYSSTSINNLLNYFERTYGTNGRVLAKKYESLNKKKKKAQLDINLAKYSLKSIVLSIIFLFRLYSLTSINNLLNWNNFLF